MSGLGDRHAALRRELNTGQAERPKRQSGSRGLAAGGESEQNALLETVRTLRRVLPIGRKKQQNLLFEIEAAAERGSSLRTLAPKLRDLVLGDVTAPQAVAPLEIAVRMALAAKPLGRALRLSGVTKNLSRLAERIDVSGDGDREFRQIEEELSTCSRRARAMMDSSDLLKGCLVDLIGSLERLSADGDETSHHLLQLREKLEASENLTDLQRLRRCLLDQADDLVRLCEERKSALVEAQHQAASTQRRAEELAAATVNGEEKARTDTLTMLGNQRELESDVTAWAEPRGDVGLIAIDVDHLPGVISEHGRAVAERVLVYVAETLRGELRGDDLAYRIGSEKFFVLLPASSWQGTRATAERLRARIAAKPTHALGRQIPVTVSIGVGAWTENESFSEARRKTDRALRRAQDAGHNRVVG